MQLFLNVYLKIFFILTPFFVVSIFLAMTQELDRQQRRRLALKVTWAVLLVSCVLYFFGRHIFSLFGITVDSFRIGAGAILFLSAVSLVKGAGKGQEAGEGEDIAVVPLAIPITVGPGATGALLVMGTELAGVGDRVLALAGLLCAVASVGLLLFTANGVERLLGQTGLSILSKLTGLIVASIAAQMIFTGVGNIL